MSKPGNIWRKVHGKITKKPTNFSWLIEEKLAGSGIPTSLDEFEWLLNQGVKSIVTMTENHYLMIGLKKLIICIYQQLIFMLQIWKK